MIKLYDEGVYLLNGNILAPESQAAPELTRKKEDAHKGTTFYSILQAHNVSGNEEQLKIKSDSIISHDPTYVGIIQTAKASGLEKFPLPYVSTCCHNSLRAVGGIIDEGDHIFGLSACRKYGGIYLPPHMEATHQYMRESIAGCGKTIPGSGSHTRYGALGTMAAGEGGGELAKQLLEQTWDTEYPEVIAAYLDGKSDPGTGPQDIAIAVTSTVLKNGYVKNKVMESVGSGVSSMSADYCNDIDVTTTETTCLSSIRHTDEDTKAYLDKHGRPEDYRQLDPAQTAHYDGCIYIDLSTIHSTTALPSHPSNGYEIRELNENMDHIFHEAEEGASKLIKDPNLGPSLRDKVRNGMLYADQGTIAGCTEGTYSSTTEAACILKGKSTGTDEYALGIHPSGQAIMLELTRDGALADLTEAGVTIRTAFCGPCFGVGDTPIYKGPSTRRTTKNFPSREGSKPGNEQLASVALMDARSIAISSANGERIMAADEAGHEFECPEYCYDSKVYQHRVLQGMGKGYSEETVTCGPNIKDWLELPELNDHMLLKVRAYITDPVTTTDELIPSGETGSFRSSPMGFAESTLSRRVPGYVGRAKTVMENEKAGKAGNCPIEVANIISRTRNIFGFEETQEKKIDLPSMIYAVKPGDGSVREQAASCQKVLLGGASITVEYATKRYRSNLINWGMIPFIMNGNPDPKDDDYISVPDIKKVLDGDLSDIPAYVTGREIKKLSFAIAPLTDEEKETIQCGSLISYNKAHKAWTREGKKNV